jgi:hypothetical protein
LSGTLKKARCHRATPKFVQIRGRFARCANRLDKSWIACETKIVANGNKIVGLVTGYTIGAAQLLYLMGEIANLAARGDRAACRLHG